jgi:hypothetical protein
MAAKTIDPAIGASTWALGSHKWNTYIGNFTKNPKIAITQKIDLIVICLGKRNSINIGMEVCIDDI